MSNPQQPELGRSRKTPAQDPDAAAGVIEGQGQPSSKGPTGPVPPENQPGHHPEKEQDKPDLNAFAEKLGVTEPEPQPRPRSAPSLPLPRGRTRWIALAPLLLLLGVVIRRSRSRSRHRRGR